MLTIALVLLGLAIVGVIYSFAYSYKQKLLAEARKNEKRILIENPKSFIDKHLKPAPKLCNWVIHELDNGKVKFSFHSYNLLEGNGYTGSFTINKNSSIDKLKHDLRYKSQKIIDDYEQHLISTNTSWTGPVGR